MENNKQESDSKGTQAIHDDPVCHIYRCQNAVTQRLMFTSGMRDYYCTQHAAMFDPEIIEDREEI